jgi:hypothetical protein
MPVTRYNRDRQQNLLVLREEGCPSSFLAPSFFALLDSALAALGESADNMPDMSTAKRTILRVVALRK